MSIQKEYQFLKNVIDFNYVNFIIVIKFFYTIHFVGSALYVTFLFADFSLPELIIGCGLPISDSLLPNFSYDEVYLSFLSISFFVCSSLSTFESYFFTSILRSVASLCFWASWASGLARAFSSIDFVHCSPSFLGLTSGKRFFVFRRIVFSPD